MAVHPARRPVRRSRLAPQRRRAEDASIAARDAASSPEITMAHRIVHRVLSIGLSALFTVLILGGVDQLSQPAENAPQWAQQQSQPASAPRA
jgi:hypothetical protein